MLRPAEVAAVVSELCTRQHDLLHTLRLSQRDLFYDAVDGHAGLASTGVGDDTKGAELVAALLDLHESPCT